MFYGLKHMSHDVEHTSHGVGYNFVGEGNNVRLLSLFMVTETFYLLRRLGVTVLGFLGSSLGANGSTMTEARRMRTSV